MRKLLFIPGPTEVNEDVLLELSKHVEPHYGVEWQEFYEKTIEIVQKIFNTKEYTTLLPVPGIVAMEMAVFNIIENEGDKIVCLNNGFFSDLIERILRLHGANVLSIKSDWGAPLNINELENVLDRNPDVKAVFMVHNETSTGVLNDISRIGKITRKYDKLLCVDAVSSFGGVEFNFDDWGVDYAVGYASKCLSGINGIVPIAISNRFIDYVRKRKIPIKSYYFNLLIYNEMSKYFTNHPHPTSMPTSVIKAFYKAAKMAIDEGLEKRYERHRKIAKAYRASIRSLNLEILAKEEFASPTVTTVIVENGLNKKITSILYEKYNIIVGGGLGILKDNTFRIGHMGNTSNKEYLIQFISSLEMTLRDLGMLKEFGKGLKVAYDQLF
jgi:alanine-glyoxylate transaminase/serine-glyoxylate transaminase/serine-pyruvate transaminase